MSAYLGYNYLLAFHIKNLTSHPEHSDPLRYVKETALDMKEESLMMI